MPAWRPWRKRSDFRLDWIQVEVSSLCNGACIYCPLHRQRDQWDGALMDWDTFERLAPVFANTGLVYLQGWGEPLLHPDIWHMVRRVHVAGAKVGFTTNAKLLDDRALAAAAESDLDILAVSLTGTTPETHECFRPSCRFRTIERALERLADRKRKLKTNRPHLHLAFLLLRSNVGELEHLPALAARWGASQIVVSNLTWIPDDLQAESSLLHPEDGPRIQEVLDAAQRDADSRGILLHHHGGGLGNPLPVCAENVLKSCFVSHRGDVSPCVFSTPGLHRTEPILFGNVRETPLREIWQSDAASQFRQVFQDRLSQQHPGTHRLSAACRDCHKLREH